MKIFRLIRIDSFRIPKFEDGSFFWGHILTPVSMATEEAVFCVNTVDISLSQFSLFFGGRNIIKQFYTSTQLRITLLELNQLLKVFTLNLLKD